MHEYIKQTKNDIKIRKATTQDIDEIIKLNKILFDLEYNNFDDTLNINRPTSDEWKSYFQDSITKNITLVATIDNYIIGYLIWNLDSQFSYNTVKQAELNNMCILDKYRKFGIGTKLINEFKKICNNNGIQEIKVTASYKNINAIEFYKKNGFNEFELTLKLEI